MARLLKLSEAVVENLPIADFRRLIGFGRTRVCGLPAGCCAVGLRGFLSRSANRRRRFQPASAVPMQRHCYRLARLGRLFRLAAAALFLARLFLSSSVGSRWLPGSNGLGLKSHRLYWNTLIIFDGLSFFVRRHPAILSLRSGSAGMADGWL